MGRHRKRLIVASVVMSILLTLATPLSASEINDDESVPAKIRIVAGYDEDISRTIAISGEEARELYEEITNINEKIRSAKSIEEYRDLVEQKIDILRDKGILPEDFTPQNMEELAREIWCGLSGNQDDTQNGGNRSFLSLPRISKPYFSLTPSVFVTFAPLKTINTVGLRPFGTILPPYIIDPSKTTVKMNATGIYMNTTGGVLQTLNMSGPLGRLIQNKSIEINSSLWRSIWSIFGDESHANCSADYVLAIYYLQLTFASSSYGFVFPKPRFILQPFVYIGLFTIPFLLSVYMVWSNIKITLLDLAVILSFLPAIIIPFEFSS
ncbi:MAG: hypothetical protein DRN19_03570 [Thermoplasmata archaeon]|nr:MAG: hypothetical protein DRN19_03570 [Thermoplasmata archaeon]